MATRLIDDTKLQNIAVAIQAKDNGGQMTVDEMPGRIEAIGVLNPALILWDWNGTKLAAYSREDALALTGLPTPDMLPPYAAADHELLVFQSWNWSLANIKTWIQNHEGETLGVGAIYTTTDGRDHNYWGNPRLTNTLSINMQKRGTTSIGNSAFQNCVSLEQISIPDGVTSIGSNAFQNCVSLEQISIPDGVTSIGSNAFYNCKALCDILNESKSTLSNTNAFDGLPSIYRIYVPRANLSWFETATNWSTIYAQGHIVAIEDHIQYLESIGFNVEAYKGAA